jgi:TRAP-type C4-dicarboxylate transport system permease small subunit
MATSGLIRGLEMVPKILVGGLVLGAIGTMLFGVLARYVLLPITNWMDVDPVNFFWVEEVGETALAWITLIGAAIGVGERSHFSLAILVHKFPPGLRKAVHYFNHAAIFAFSLLVAWLGYKLALLNYMLTSPALEFSLAWIYAPAAAGGLLMAVYAIKSACDPSEHTIDDVRE